MEEKIPFVHLHLHTMKGSFLDGVSSSSDYAKKAVEYGHPAIAVTEHGRLASWLDHQKACEAEEIKPILGVEMYMVNNLVELNGEKRIRGETYHLILLATNEQGYKNILKLNYLSNKDTDHYYYNPRITFDELFEHNEGIMVGTACIASKWGKLLRQGREQEAKDLFLKFKEIFGDRFYAEVQLNELTEEMENLQFGQKSLNDWIIKTAKENDVPVVLTGDVHYVDPGMDVVQTIGIAIRNKETIDNLSFELEGKSLFYARVQDFLRFNKEFGYNYEESDILEWANNSVKISDRCNYKIPDRVRMCIPSQSEDDDSLLVSESIAGLKKKFGEKPPKKYQERLKEELDVLIEKGFSSYLLLYKDIFDYVESEKLWGSIGRGSAAGSLVAYCLGITKLDPIKYDLLFSRFLSKSRAPDVVYNYF